MITKLIISKPLLRDVIVENNCCATDQLKTLIGCCPMHGTADICLIFSDGDLSNEGNNFDVVTQRMRLKGGEGKCL